MARKPNGQDDHRPEVVDLRRYRQAAAKRKASPPPSPPKRGRRPGQREPFLGPRRNAGMILALVAIVLLALWLLPTLL